MTHSSISGRSTEQRLRRVRSWRWLLISSSLCLWFAALLITQQARGDDGANAPAPIRIGATVSRTGELAEFSEQQIRGMRQFVRDINNRGALLGRPVELVTIDDESTKAGAQAAVGRLLAEGISLFVSPYSSELTLAIREQIQAADVAMIAVASAPAVFDRANSRIFGLYTPAERNMLPLLRLAQDQKLSRLALLYQTSDFPEAVASGVRQQAANYGLTLVLDQAYDPDNPQPDQLAGQIAASKAQVVVAASYLDDSVALTKAIRANGEQPRLLAFSGGPALREFGNTTGITTADGVISSVQWMRGVRFPGSFDFGFRYRDQHGIYPSYDAAGGYAALQVLEAAVRLAGNDNPGEVREQLSNMKFRSILGHYRVDEFGRQQAKSTYLVQWQDAHISLVYPPEVSRWPVRYRRN